MWTYDNGEADKNTFRTKAEIEIPFEGVEYQKIYRFDDIADRLYMKMHNMTIRTETCGSIRSVLMSTAVLCGYRVHSVPFILYVKTICFVDAFVYYYRLGREGQSVGLEKMQKNEQNYDKVLSSLLSFYQQLVERLPCTDIKKRYIAGLIARVIAGKFKIMLSFPPSAEKTAAAAV
ncbi:MAG: hypothetical protein ACLUD2_08030 [Clostridium sp.]